MLTLVVTLISIVALGLDTVHRFEAAPASEQSQPWITVHEGGELLRLEAGHYIRFEGTGHLHFGSDRTLVQVQRARSVSAFIDGVPIREKRAVQGNATVEIQGRPATQWHIRPADRAEVEAITDATRITDDAPDSPARIDADIPITFFVYIDTTGGTAFIYPED